jgi:hypothetical protein
MICTHCGKPKEEHIIGIDFGGRGCPFHRYFCWPDEDQEFEPDTDALRRDLEAQYEDEMELRDSQTDQPFFKRVTRRKKSA